MLPLSNSVTSLKILSPSALSLPPKSISEHQAKVAQKQRVTANKSAPLVSKKILGTQQEKAMREELSIKIKELDHRVQPKQLKDARHLANTAIDLVEQHKRKEMPWRGPLLRMTSPSRSELRDEMLTAKQYLKAQLKDTKLEGINADKELTAELTSTSLQTLKRYRNYTQTGGENLEESSRKNVNIARELLITTATAWGARPAAEGRPTRPALNTLAYGVFAGASVAGVTKLLDGVHQRLGGKSIITTTPVADGANIAGTATAMVLPDLFHSNSFLKNSAIHLASDIGIGAAAALVENRSKYYSSKKADRETLNASLSAGVGSFVSIGGVEALSKWKPNKRDWHHIDKVFHFTTASNINSHGSWHQLLGI